MPSSLQCFDMYLMKIENHLGLLPGPFFPAPAGCTRQWQRHRLHLQSSNCLSWHAGITILYAEQAAPAPVSPAAGAAAASVLALPLSAVMQGPFVLSAGAPLASGFAAPPYLQGFRLSELPAGSLLPVVSFFDLTQVSRTPCMVSADGSEVPEWIAETPALG